MLNIYSNMITFIQFMENVEEDSEKDAFIDQFQLNIDKDKGFYANINEFDKEKLKDRLKSWSKYEKMSPADKKNIESIINKKSSKVFPFKSNFKTGLSSLSRNSVPEICSL